jgi:hypothetical protein
MSDDKMDQREFFRTQHAGCAMKHLKAERDRLYRWGGEELAKDTAKSYRAAMELYAQADDFDALVGAIEMLNRATTVNQNGS